MRTKNYKKNEIKKRVCKERVTNSPGSEGGNGNGLLEDKRQLRDGRRGSSFCPS